MFVGAHANADNPGPGQSSIIGLGVGSCGTWTTNRRTQGFVALAEQQWVVGFLSGVGFLGYFNNIDPLRGVDADGVWAWIDNYCMAKPLDNIADASGAFARAHPNK